MDARLKILSGSRAGETVSVPRGKLLVGREKGCDLSLDGEHVNRNHCLFLLDEDGLSIRDLNTTNGTYVNGRRVARGETLRLHDDDIVSVASINERTFRITLGSGPVGTPRATREGRPSARSLEPDKTDEIKRERAKTYSGNLAPLKAVPLGSAPEEPSVLPFLDDNGPRFGAGAAESNPNALTSQLEFAHEPQTARVTLDVVAGPKNGARFEFQQHSTFLVGRGPWTHLCLSEDLHFSRHHLRIEIHPPDCQLIDLGSRNGTFVNGNRVNSTFLRDGDIVSGGKTEIRVGVNAATPMAHTPTVLGSISSTANYAGKYSDADGKGRAPSQLIPGYELREQLGVGAMGIVYRAVHTSTGQEVAIKLVGQKLTTSERAIQLFVREANLLARLDHPNIVRGIDFGYTAGQLYLVMECVPKISLQDVLARETSAGCIRIPCGIIRQVLQALEHAHRMSIVHRDIKPENVLLFRKGRTLKAKLADFGLAKNYASAGLSEISHEGDLRGTIAYMPPELVVDCRNAGPAGDIYSVGATLYYYLSRQLPFDFSKRNKLAVVLEDDPIPLEQRVPEVPKKLAKIVHRALAKEKTDRFATAGEMCEALAPFETRRQKPR